MLLRNGLLMIFSLLLGSRAIAQRSYAPQSVLATGTWYKLAVSKQGIYKIDIPFLSGLGINSTNLSSSSIRLFGNGGGMLSESNGAVPIDDLRENAIQVVDGGDGILNGTDFILFYSNGPHNWQKDSVNQRFTHQFNLYSKEAYYFLQIGGSGLRIPQQPNNPSPAIPVMQYNGRYFHELDTVNFLASGKEWFGEEFTDAPGRTLSRRFEITAPNIVNGTPVVVKVDAISRSVGSGSRFDFLLNDQALPSLSIAPIGTGVYELFARQSVMTGSVTANRPELTLQVTYAPGSFNAQGWLNWFEIFPRQQLSLLGLQQLAFRDWQSVGNPLAEFIISDAPAGTRTWDVTDPLHPVQMEMIQSGNTARFTNNSNRLREYIAFTETDLLIPVAAGRVQNQNLHAASPTDHLILTHPSLMAEAQRLAQFHQQQNGLRTIVVTTDQVFNEFASGIPDPGAIRNWVKMYHDVFAASPANRPRYLLLFGDASYDYKDRLQTNTNLVPAYQHSVSLDPLSTYTSDDFFGYLDDAEDINAGGTSLLLDIGIGRVPAKNLAEAKNFVDKVYQYFTPSSMGPWRNNLSFVADDEDQNLHLQDAEIITGTVASVAPVFDRQKVYLDAFRQESGTGGSTYPQVNDAINNQLYNGTLIWNFTGHGGPRRLADETILDQEMVNSWNNANRLPLFMTATCDFAPYDNPLINSLGENILLRPKTGAIALMTTTRIVFSFSNRIINNNYLQFALQPDANGRYRSLGDAVREAKNFTYQTSADITNNRKFTLLGDPGLTLAFPSVKATATLINGRPAAQADTLSAAERITIEGEVTDLQGNTLTGFNGSVYPSVYDKPQSINTLANDPGSQVTSFITQSNILFKGKATVSAGRFSFSFKVPRDINYQFGNGKLSLYVEDGQRDGTGAYTGFLVGGSSGADDNDKEGPEIKPYLNDESFVNGGISNENPVLVLKLADSSGINTVGTGIGHDIVATLDNDNERFFILNDFYQGELDSYQQGTVRFQLPELEPGPHTLKIKAWDVLNNSSEVLLDFTVAKDEELVLSHVLNYPNPFTTRTQFWFEHNKPGQELQVRVQIFTLTGRVIKVIKQAINTVGNRSSELEWDGRDEFGDKIGRGVYLYKLSVTAPGKLRKEKIEKLVIF